MGNHNEVLDDANFENELNSMNHEDQTRFTAREIHMVGRLVTKHEKRINALEHSSRHSASIGGIIGTTIATAAYFLWQFFNGRK